MAQTEKKNYTMHVLVVLLIIASFALGSLYTRVKYLEKGTSSNATVNQTTNAKAPPVPTIGINQVKDAFNKSLIKFGDTSKKVILLEVADPSCPYCHVAGGHNKELNNQVGDRFRMVADGGTYVAPVPEMKKLADNGKASFAYIYMPGHGNGEMGAKAMYCAFAQGKFWEVHDKLMTNDGYTLMNETVKNDKAKAAEVADFLKSVFDPVEMKKCLDSGKYDAQLQTDIGLASALDVSGTPGFFVNANNFAGAYSYKEMEATVNSALK